MSAMTKTGSLSKTAWTNLNVSGTRVVLQNVCPYWLAVYVGADAPGSISAAHMWLEPYGTLRDLTLDTGDEVHARLADRERDGLVGEILKWE